MKLKKKIAILLSIIMVFTAAGSTTAFAANDNKAGSVTYASSAIDVNGTDVDIKGYIIQNNNYFKLREIANSLKDTNKKFQVEYDEETHSVIITTGKAYEPDGTETYVPSESHKDVAIPSSSEIYIDGEKVTLQAYNVNGNNYVKLRDVAVIMDFALMYYHEDKRVSFETDKDYSKSQEFYNESGDNPDNPGTDPGNNPSDDPGDDPGTTPENPNAGEDPGNDKPSVSEYDPSGQYSLQEINEYSQYFTNLVDGYRIMISKTMKPDMTMSEIRTVLKNEHMQIEIYNQDLTGNSSFAAYVNYSNKFVDDSSTYKKIASYNTTIAGKSAYVLEWKRNPLARVNNDKCHYASVDVKMPNNKVLTFLFKSSQPFDANGGKSYINILNTLTDVQKTASPGIKKTVTVENTHWNQETKELYSKYFSKDSNLEWGIFQPLAPLITSRIDDIEKKLETKFKFIIYYTNVGTDLTKMENTLNAANDQGRTVELTLQTVENDNGKGNMLMDILDGKYDDFLNNYARVVSNSEKPVIFRFCNEMNGDWCMYSAYHSSKDTELYKECYKYVYGIFQKNNALKNTIWVWNPNWKSYPYYDWNHALCYYPGDEYVDLVGMTAYNTGTYYSGETWTEFKTLYDAFYYQYCAWFSQPLMITEFACSSYGGDKEKWVTDMLKQMSNYDRIKVAIWWSGCDYDSSGSISRPYFIDDNNNVMEVFRQYFKTHPSNAEFTSLNGEDVKSVDLSEVIIDRIQ